MSYAEAAAKGPNQSPEEVENTESQAASLIDVNSPHVSSLRSDDNSQGEQAAEGAESLQQEVKAKARDLGDRAYDTATDAQAEAKKRGKKTQRGAEETGRKLDANKENPVVIANGVILLVGTAAVGLGAYKKYTEGTLDWKFAGITAGVIGTFAVADYYVSQWMFKNKYPPKN